MVTTLIQDNTGSITFYLELTAGGAATGLTFSDVTIDIKKEGEASFTNKTISGSNFTELSSGYYELDFTATDTDILGNLYTRISGGTIQPALAVASVAAQAVVNPSTTPAPSTTTLFGFIFGSDGLPLSGASVSASVLSRPTLLHPTDEGIGVSTGLVVAETDSEGYFTLSLLTGATVDVVIGSMDYRRTLVVPGSNTNLFDIA